MDQVCTWRVNLVVNRAGSRGVTPISRLKPELTGTGSQVCEQAVTLRIEASLIFPHWLSRSLVGEVELRGFTSPIKTSSLLR